MRKLVCLFVAVTFICLLFPGICISESYKETIATNIGRLYYVLNPVNEMQYPVEIEKYIRTNRELLQDSGPIIKYVRALGEKLVQSGINSFSKNDYNRAYGSVLNMGGSMEDANKVAQSIQQGATDTFAMGQELLWIARVIPKAANGDWVEFKTTGTQSRMMIRQLWPIYRQMGSVALLNQTMLSFQPMMEEQVKFFALMFLD